MLRVVILTLGIFMAGVAHGDPLDPLYRRIAKDLRQGKPLVITVHVALCDNNIIHCGGRGRGNGDQPGRNLYWGGAAGFRATFDHARRFYRRVHLDGGDGRVILQRVVYRHRVRRPSARWQRLGVTRAFDVLVVGLAYRGGRIADAIKGFFQQVALERGQTLKLGDKMVRYGGLGHVVGYAGHNYLMDAPALKPPRITRNAPVGFFALACLSAPYMARGLQGGSTHALLLTRSLMYPGAFTVDGLVRGISAAEPQRRVFLRGVQRYAAAQGRPERVIRWAFTHDGRPSFQRRYLGRRP